MPPRLALATPLRAWRCPQCVFSTSARQQAFGPEHPAYLEVPEPPQQGLPYRPFPKGRLPVPRDIFPGKEGLYKADDAAIAKSTQEPTRHARRPEKGSREEWKVRMSEARRRNLREGLKDLRTRKVRERNVEATRKQRDAQERRELRAMPEREDERLTTPSHGLDVETLLYSRTLPDPTREARMAHKARNQELHVSARRAARLDNLHTLYMNARTFIVTPEQLDQAIEEEFDQKVFTGGSDEPSGQSVWAQGPPMTVQQMLRGPGRGEWEAGLERNKERVRRIAEKLTGGKMEEK